MELREAEEKYLEQTVRHMATGLLFRVCEIHVQYKTNQIIASFELPGGEVVPVGQQTEERLRELETHYHLAEQSPKRQP